MDCVTKLLCGSDLIHQKLNGPKELPTSGWKEYCPNNSWLEQKQIQVSLEDKYLMIGVERIEKQSNLAKAEWHVDRKKAKVLKQIGKHWEVVGHHQDNELWLLPEEALYLLEINVLELFHDGVPVSVEHAYALLLNESNNVTLSEYRVYSYLSRRGYKLIRHAEDITVTRYEKQVHLDQVLETHKRSIPGERTNTEKQFPVDVSNPEILAGTPNVTAGISGKPIQKTSINKDAIPIESCRSKRISDSEDVCIIEDNIEVIEIEDIAHKIVPQNKREESCTPAKQAKNKKQCKSKISECLIIIDEELEDKNVQKDIKMEKSDSLDSESDDDVILVKSVRLESRKWYKALGRCMLPTEPVFVDLSEDQSVEVKLENGNGQNESLRIVEQKSRKDILDEMPNAESGISFIKTPKAICLPKGIVPRHSQYRVNLNMRQEQTIQHNEYFYAPNRRSQQFYNPNFSLNQTNNTFFGDNVLMQACEMRAMALSMIQAASSLMSVVNGTQAQPSPPLVNDTHTPSFNNSAQFSNPSYQPRFFSNNLFNSNNFFSNSFYNNPRNQYLARNPYGRRNFRFRGNRNNRSFSSHHKHLSRYNNNKASNSNNVHEVVLIDSEDEAVGEQRGKRGVKHHETPVKKGKFSNSIEIIDLCEEKVIKNEPGVPSKISGKESSDIIEHDYDSEQNDIEQKPDILIECKQESSLFDVVENPQRRFSADVELKKEQTDLRNVEESEIKNEKIVESEVKDIELLNINSEKLETQTCESPQSCMDIISSESPRIIEESNDSETVDVIVESTVAEFQAYVPENKLKDIEQPTSWQQYKEISDQGGMSLDEEMRNGENIVALTKPDHSKDIASLLKSLQIFESIEFDEQKEKKQNLKISFDAYLPTDHFKKSLKMLPKFRIIVVK
uniref:tRNA_int_end_N2 domain-containing protein n=1 Tax=Rhodnius prolixus TaxID=13249 RepID=T1H9I1_RHOPR